MASTLPILISRNDVVFPHSNKELDLGRRFSINAVKNAVSHFGGRIITINQKNCDLDEPQPHDLLSIGTLCVVQSKQEFPDGSARVVVQGLQRVEISKLAFSSEDEESKFWIAEFSLLKDVIKDSIQCRDDISEFLDGRPDIFDYKSPEMVEVLRSMDTDQPDLSKVSDLISSIWPKFNINSLFLKKQLITEIVVDKRVEIISRAEYITESVKKILNERITRKVSKQISKQQKEFYLREKLRIIKEELGDSSSKDAEISRIKARLVKEPFPEHIDKRIKEELQRLELCSSYSNESTVIRSYLDWLLAMPWTQVSEDEKDLKKIQKTLDESHYGLEKIKDRIIEFIAVQKKSKEPKGSIICFVGPPGVGKTSLAQAIANALNKEFVKISLGGLYDESELRGHRKTYVASMPGKIIRAIRQCKVKNPVFLLDEIDKISNGYHGDPIYALLEILDPKQNTLFNDHYLEENFDLSQVMFIATANYEDNIPDPLLNRMEVIHLGSYTELEKLQIMKTHLIPEVLKECGLTSKELSFTDKAMELIIQKYTREAGIRNLKQCIAKIARKFVKRQLTESIEKQKITPKEVKEYLEYEIYDFTIKDEVPMAGVVNGMAYTECGGDLLPIEVNHMPGKGNLSLTGNLRDTMKESASVALAYVRANEDAFEIKNKEIDWNNIDVNLHVPTGGIPKDGPSAGVTITTAIISSFTDRPVPTNVAMTGEITLRGKVMPIGGLKEKVISAVRGGIDTVFYPSENTKHLIDIPKEIKDKVTFIPVKHYQEIYDRLFTK